MLTTLLSLAGLVPLVLVWGEDMEFTEGKDYSDADDQDTPLNVLYNILICRDVDSAIKIESSHRIRKIKIRKSNTFSKVQETIVEYVAYGFEVTDLVCQLDTRIRGEAGGMGNMLYGRRVELLPLVSMVAAPVAAVDGIMNAITGQPTKSISTPMETANGVKFLRFLIKQGASVETKSVNGLVPLHYAAAHGNKHTARVLLRSGAEVDIRAPNRHNSTSLILAAWNGHTAVVELLIANEADVNARTKPGWTALFYAVEEDHVDVVRVLVEAGADVTIRAEGYQGVSITASDLARSKKVSRLLGLGPPQAKCPIPAHPNEWEYPETWEWMHAEARNTNTHTQEYPEEEEDPYPWEE